jgi:putative ABC transport system substrate-binding protein
MWKLMEKRPAVLDPSTEALALEKSASAAGKALNRAILVVNARTDQEFAPAFASARERAVGTIIPNQPIFAAHHRQIAALATRFRLPAAYDPEDLASSGGLVSYGASIYDIFRQVGVLAGKIFAGTSLPSFLLSSQTAFN